MDWPSSVPLSPFRYRARVVAAVGVGLATAMFLGSLASGYGWIATALTVGVVAGAASLICQAAELPPPRELMLVMAVLVATEPPSDLRQAAQRAGLTAVGAAIAWVVTMVPVIRGRHEPELRALDDALLSTGSLLTTVGTAEEPTARHAAVLAARTSADCQPLGQLEPGRPARCDREANEHVVEATIHLSLEGCGPLHPQHAADVLHLRSAIRDPGAALVDGHVTPARCWTPRSPN